MSKIKKFLVEHSTTYGNIIVEVDFSFVKKIKTETGEEDYPLIKGIEEMVKFWSGWEDRLEENEGDYLNTFLKELCGNILGTLGSKNLNAYGIIKEIEGEEGWCPIDGSWGIKLLEVTSPDFHTQENYSIQEL